MAAGPAAPLFSALRTAKTLPEAGAPRADPGPRARAALRWGVGALAAARRVSGRPQARARWPDRGARPGPSRRSSGRAAAPGPEGGGKGEGGSSPFPPPGARPRHPAPCHPAPPHPTPRHPHLAPRPRLLIPLSSPRTPARPPGLTRGHRPAASSPVRLPARPPAPLLPARRCWAAGRRAPQPGLRLGTRRRRRRRQRRRRWGQWQRAREQHRQRRRRRARSRTLTHAPAPARALPGGRGRRRVGAAGGAGRACAQRAGRRLRPLVGRSPE